MDGFRRLMKLFWDYIHVIIFYENCEILLIQNPKRGWKLPGGTVEQGEAITEALKREIYEESGILCEPEHLAGVYQNLVVKEGYGPLEGMKIRM